MRGVFTVVLGILLLGALSFFGFRSYAAHEKARFDASGKAYVDMMAPKIMSTPDDFSQELLKQASPALLQQLTTSVNSAHAQGHVDQEAQRIKKLGDLKSYSGGSGESSVSFTFHGKEVTASYTGTAYFTNGPMLVFVDLEWVKNQWQIRSLQLSPVRE
jgi:hypothetical protein